MYGVLHWLEGFLTVFVGGINALDAINILHREEYPIRKLRPTEGGYLFNCTVFCADDVADRLEELNVPYEIKKRSGLPFIFGTHIRRPGLVVGLFFALLLVYGSTRLVWDVRVESSEMYDEDAVISALSDVGVHTGAKLHDIDVYKAEQSFLINNPQYSKIVINLRGTVVNVQLRLRNSHEHAEVSDGGFDIVAKEAGLVQSVVANKGEPAVQKWDTVEKGDLLISGTVYGVHGACYLYHARGSVTATVYREYTVMIPLKTEEKIYTGREKTKTAYSVLGKEFAIFSDESSPFDYADVQTSRQELKPFGLRIPVIKETVKYSEYVLQAQTITVSQAEEKARAAFDAYLDREVEGEIVNTVIEVEYNSELEAVLLSATAEIITEIGEERAIAPLSE